MLNRCGFIFVSTVPNSLLRTMTFVQAVRSSVPSSLLTLVVEAPRKSVSVSDTAEAWLISRLLVELMCAPWMATTPPPALILTSPIPLPEKSWQFFTRIDPPTLLTFMAFGVLSIRRYSHSNPVPLVSTNPPPYDPLLCSMFRVHHWYFSIRTFLKRGFLRPTPNMPIPKHEEAA